MLIRSIPRLLVLVLMQTSVAMAAERPDALAIDAAESKRLAAEVKTEFLHAWNGYKQYAWGHDDLAPLSHKPHDWYGTPLLMTPVDALDTLILMGLTEEADAARELIATQLDFDKDIYVKNFEITIRLLGGLLSSYQMTGDERLLAQADDLGTRLLPAFDSPTGLPWVEVNLHTGKTRNPKTNPAETGTLLLEFGTLSELTGNPVYSTRPNAPLVETFKRRSSARPGRLGDRCRNRQMDGYRIAHLRRHRFVLRVPVEVLAPVRRPGVPGDVEDQHCVCQRASGR